MKSTALAAWICAMTIALTAMGARCYGDPIIQVEPPTLTGSVVTLPARGDFTVELLLDEFCIMSCGDVYKIISKKDCGAVLDGALSLVIQDVQFDPDPFLLHNILLTNLTGQTQTYELIQTLPAAFGQPNLIAGSITMQVIDNGTDGATVSAPANDSVYTALIDGAVVRTMQGGGFSCTAPAGGVNNALETFGFDVSSVPVIDNMAIRLTFQLTPWDTVSILSRFDVVAIPEPATMTLLTVGAGVLALASRRRRKKS